MSDSERDVQNTSTASENVASNAEEDAIAQRRQVPSILNGKYFTIVEEKSNEKCVTVLCQVCLPKRVEIKGQLTSSYNFRSHLKRKHSLAFDEYVCEMGNRKQRSDITKGGKGKIDQNLFELDIARYVISAMIPLKSVDDKYFCEIFKNLGLDKTVNIISRRTLGRRINTLYVDEISQLKEDLINVDFVCTTADIWSGRRRSFLGVTVHWISPMYERKSAALACRRFGGTHCFSRITDMLHNVHAEFNLNVEKIVATVTDNGSNFVKAFKTFGVKEQIINIETEEDYSNSSLTSSSDEEEEEEELEEERGNHTQTNDQFTYLLPRHIRCAAHTLNLCITSDMMHTINNDETLSVIHTDVIQKCNILWKAAMRPKSAEIVETIIGHAIKRPGETRWNSLYDSLKQILSIKDKMNDLAKALGIKNILRENDFLYITEHLKCTAPMAEALDILQGENNVFYGTLLPCLLSLQRKLNALIELQWKYCKPLTTCLRDSLEKRFAEFFMFSTPEANNSALAALTHPKFKNRWFTCINEDHRERLMNLFQKEVAEKMKLDNEQIPSSSASTSQNDFFYFGEIRTVNVADYSSKAALHVSNFIFM